MKSKPSQGRNPSATTATARRDAVVSNLGAANARTGNASSTLGGPRFNQPPGLQPPGGAMPHPMGPMPGMQPSPPPRMAPYTPPRVGTRYPGGGNRMF